MAFEKELQTLGLSEKESAVYLAALELGPETAQNLAKKAGINRPTTYVQIELLKQKGLMSEVMQGKKTLYVAESPERIESLLNNFEKELEFKRAEVARILPGLSELFSTAGGTRPKVRFFESKEATAALTAEYLNVKDKKIESIINLDRVMEVFPGHQDDYSPKRIKKGIKGFLIYTRKEGPMPELNDPAKLREARYIAPENLPISADIDIYDDKVAISTYHKEKPISVLIESHDIAQTMRGIFYFIWGTLK
ncbi:MAG: helix-turn-helix domain-containing protein [bacterium]|nr:helix-turn-helix domain-containing protein [bacterium]